MPREGAASERGGAAPDAALPCLTVTTAYQEQKKEENRPLPGPRKKQAQALVDNIKWLAETFGKERIGFETLTVGDIEMGGKFRNLRDRKEAQRRFHSFADAGERHGKGDGAAILGPGSAIHAHIELAVRKNGALDLDFEIFIPVKILDRNSQVCFHKAMVTVRVMKANCARDRARAVV